MYANRGNLTRNELLLRFNELEAVIRSPVAEANLDKAAALAMYIARSARDGPIANLAMQAMSAIHLQKSGRRPDDGSLEKILSQLRTALKEAKTGD